MQSRLTPWPNSPKDINIKLPYLPLSARKKKFSFIHSFHLSIKTKFQFRNPGTELIKSWAIVTNLCAMLCTFIDYYRPTDCSSNYKLVGFCLLAGFQLYSLLCTALLLLARWSTQRRLLCCTLQCSCCLLKWSSYNKFQTQFTVKWNLRNLKNFNSKKSHVLFYQYLMWQKSVSTELSAGQVVTLERSSSSHIVKIKQWKPFPISSKPYLSPQSKGF